MVIRFQCDTWQQLQYEFQSEQDNSRLYKNMAAANTIAHPGGGGILTEAAMYDSHPAEFMDWWTVFYWGWWISWAPFVGMFIARICRGRTIRQLILGAFVAPTTFSFLWLTVFGSLGIKMQRVAELALGTAADVDWAKGTVDCAALGYVDKMPSSAAAMALADKGYYALACRGGNSRIFDIMAPYKEVSTSSSSSSSSVGPARRYSPHHRYAI
jgi:hypothetical protein